MSVRLKAALFTLAILLVGASPAAAQISVQIQRVGLDGRFMQAYGPEPVTIGVENRAQTPTSFDLQLHLTYRIWPTPVQGYTVHAAVSLAPGEARSLDVPLVDLMGRGSEFLVAEARGADGALLGEGHRWISQVTGSEQFVVIVCAEHAICEKVQSAIQSGGTIAEQQAKLNEQRFLALERAPIQGWYLNHAFAVVVAKPEASLDVSERESLEWYARGGGRLILLEAYLRSAKAAASQGFLSPYRSAVADGYRRLIGKGQLLEFASESDTRFESAFTRVAPNGMVSLHSGCFGACGGLEGLREGVGTTPEYPGFAWVLVWMLVYIVAVGVVNFSILHRIRRRELAWITIPGLALLFAGGIYAATEARLPSQYLLDDLAVNWMDDGSARGAINDEVTILAPRSDEVGLNLTGDAVFSGPTTGSFQLGDYVGTFSTHPIDLEEFRLGEQQSVKLRMARRSYARLDFVTRRKLPGTVRRVGNTTLENQTGLDFERAIFISGARVYPLGRVAAGARIDWLIAKAKSIPVPVVMGMELPRTRRARAARAGQDGSSHNSPFEPEDHVFVSVLREFWNREYYGSWPGDMFLGISSGPTVNASLAGVKAVRNEHMLTIVQFEQEP